MRAIFLPVVALALVGCHGVQERVAERTETQSVELDKSEMVRVEMSLGAGELRLQGGTSKLMEGSFKYHGNRKPEIAYRPNSFRSRLTIQSGGREDDKGIHMGGFAEQWNVRLNEDAPMDLDIKLGAGESQLNLGGFNIRDLDVNLGAGSVRLDLRGKPKRNMNVRIRGGVGEAKVWLPSDAGVRADVRGGIGSINVTGLTKRGSSWENEQYQSSPVTVNLDVSGGTGSISIYGR